MGNMRREDAIDFLTTHAECLKAEIHSQLEYTPEQLHLVACFVAGLGTESELPESPEDLTLT